LGALLLYTGSILFAGQAFKRLQIQCRMHFFSFLKKGVDIWFFSGYNRLRCQTKSAGQQTKTGYAGVTQG
jgi:hypothetical protein